MKMMALNAYESGGENWITSTQGICPSMTTYKKSKPKLDNLKEGGMPQYHNSQRSRNRSSDEEKPQKNLTNSRMGVCPSVG